MKWQHESDATAASEQRPLSQHAPIVRLYFRGAPSEHSVGDVDGQLLRRTRAVFGGPNVFLQCNDSEEVERDATANCVASLRHGAVVGEADTTGPDLKAAEQRLG